MINYKKINGGRIKPKRGKFGFTLIELLLGLSIFSLIALTVYTTFWSGVKLSKRSKGLKNSYLEMLASVDILSRDLQGMVYYDFSGSYPESVSFQGSKHSMRFIIPTKNGLKVVKYFLTSMDDTKVHTILLKGRYSKNINLKQQEANPKGLKYLIREEQDFASYISTIGKNEAEEEIICMNVKEGGLRLSYGKLEGTQEKSVEWKTSWDKSELPAVVRIELEILTGDERQEFSNFTRNVFIPTAG